jgi:PAS domain S-box-containing protein
MFNNLAWQILLVDDDQEDFLLTYGMLRASPEREIQLDWRSSYRTGMQAITEGKHYDAALIDYDLGEHTGIEFIREATALGCPFPLILYTGRGSREVDQEAMQAGATLYLTKMEATSLLVERLIRYAIERKQAEQALREARAQISEREAARQQDAIQHEMLESLFSTLYLAVALLDCECNFLRVNPTYAALDGQSQEFFLGKNHFELYPQPENEAIFRQVLETGQPYQAFSRPFEYPEQPERGTTYWDWTLQPVHSQNGEVGGLILILLDVTERRQAEIALARTNQELEQRVKSRTEEVQRYAARLAESNQELENFALVASHDLQEPLRKIEAFGERLVERISDRLNATEKDYLQRMLAAAHRMREMIDGLLTLSRMSKREMKTQAVDLNQVAQAVLDDLEVRIRQCQGQVQVGQLPTVQADPLQMQLLLQNLVSNALKFQQPGVPPQVSVYSLEQADGQAAFVVEDNGIGIDQDGISRLFQPFQRLNERSQYEGSGMGLAICRKITERHGGSIAVESEVGQGSKFFVRLKH